MAFRWLSKSSITLFVFALLVGNLLVGAKIYNSDDSQEKREEAFQQLDLFTTVLEQVREYYVDEDKTNYETLIQGSLEGMLSSLDPHSQFMDEKSYSDMKDDTQGQFGGIGVVISVKDGILTVVSPMEGTPGWRAGLAPGDKIIEIDGKSTEGVLLQDAVTLLRGVPGTTVKIKVVRPDTSEINDHVIMRSTALKSPQTPPAAPKTSSPKPATPKPQTLPKPKTLPKPPSDNDAEERMSKLRERLRAAKERLAEKTKENETQKQ